MSNSQGWKAMCTDCPTTTGATFGEPVHVGKVFTEGGDCYAEAVGWGLMHRYDNPGHNVDVVRFMSMEFDVEQINPKVWKLLFGG